MSSHTPPDSAGSRAAGIETPSGKGAGDENFPVGSFLLPARFRPHVARYYAFARAIDDIADNPDLAAGDKVARLDLMADAIQGETDGDPALDTARRTGMSGVVFGWQYSVIIRVMFVIGMHSSRPQRS